MLTGHRSLRGRRLPPLNGWSLPSRRHSPARDACVTRHQQRFPGSRPIGLPRTSGRHGWSSGPLGFPVSFAPSRSGTGHARHGGDRSNTTCSYVSSISRTSSTSSLTTRDLVSQDPPQPAPAAPLPARRRTTETATRAGQPRPLPRPKTHSRRWPDQRIPPSRITWIRFSARTIQVADHGLTALGDDPLARQSPRLGHGQAPLVVPCAQSRTGHRHFTPGGASAEDRVIPMPDGRVRAG